MCNFVFYKLSAAIHGVAKVSHISLYRNVLLITLNGPFAEVIGAKSVAIWQSDCQKIFRILVLTESFLLFQTYFRG